MKKGYISSLVAALVLSVSLPVGAANVSIENVNNTLVEKGLDKSIVELMPISEKDEIYKALIENPDNVQITHSFMNVDNLAQIEYFTNTDDQELLKTGITNEDIKSIRKSLKKLEDFTFDELNKKKEISNFEYKLLQKALTKNPNYKNQKVPKNNEVTSSGQISSSKLAFDMVVTNKTASYPLYSVYMYYNWSSPYFTDIFNDKIGVVWSGDFNTQKITTNADYYKASYELSKYYDKHGSYNLEVSQTPNTGIVFSTPQSKSVGTAQNKFGTMNFEIYKNSKSNESKKIVSQYAHAITAIGGVSLSIPPSVDIGVGYDSSPQRAANITN
ncbi:hypothetical protein MKY27_13985 [Solibacillus sp. FSL R5-0449]|uniref:hypothetical protein n=1 Tax=Solibacillus sp. FSL R5-0449 TaxID=2921639 RepID=UPI0030D104C1